MDETARFGRFDRPSMVKPPHPVSGRCFRQLSGFRLLFVGWEGWGYFLTGLVTPFRLSTTFASSGWIPRRDSCSLPCRFASASSAS